VIANTLELKQSKNVFFSLFLLICMFGFFVIRKMISNTKFALARLA